MTVTYDSLLHITLCVDGLAWILGDHTGGVDVCGDIVLTVAVTHAGPTADVIVQVYMQFLNASVPVPR
eukprot:SAG11_NODE_11247_length_774_cov_0.862222_1_plen_68_part_00